MRNCSDAAITGVSERSARVTENHWRGIGKPKGEASYSAWRPALLRHFEELDESAVLVGHPVGGTILLPCHCEAGLSNAGATFYSSRHPMSARRWVGDGVDPMPSFAGLPSDIPGFFYHGAVDVNVAPEHVKLWARDLPHATRHLPADPDHQLDNYMSEVPPDIRDLAW